MIQVKLSTIISSIEILKKIADSPISGITAYRVAKLLKRIEEEFELFNNGRKKIIDAYSVKRENGEPIIENDNYKIDQTRIKDFNKEVNILLDTLVTIDLPKIPLSELQDIKFTPSEILLIEDFIEE